ncbi:MAG: TonB-dependent receptor [Leadbetterella sp.]
MFRFFLLIYLLPLGIIAQNAILEGKVIDKKSSTPLENVSVSLKGTSYFTKTDRNGEFQIKGLKNQAYRLTFSIIGYEKYSMEVFATENSNSLKVSMIESAAELDDVTVKGITQEQAEAKEIKLNVNPVTVITAKQIESRAGNLNEILARQAGVQLRQSGGLGSDSRISVRGLEGKRVAIFLDGNPLNSPDGSLGINDFPVQLIERIEIYKGSVPAYLGGDGLGSAVNVVLRHRDMSYIDVNVARQTYNTSISSLILKKTFDKSGIEVGVGIFDTRSDNDYTMLSPYQPDLKILRNHDKYRSLLVGGAIRFHKLWFDEIEIETGYITNDKQIQGIYKNIQHVESKGIAMVGAMNLTKQNFIGKKIGLKYNLIYAKFNVKFVDTSSYNYEWDGTRKPSSLGKGELGNGPNLSTNLQNDLRHRINLDYRLNPKFTINFNNTARSVGFTPNDDVGNEYAGKNIFNFPGSTQNSTTGITLESRFGADKLLISAAVKHYYNIVKGYNTSIYSNNSTPDPVKNSTNEIGYNTGIRYSFTNNFFLKTSYERGVRLPNNTELFGDGILITPTTYLKPEISSNFNFGVIFDKNYGQNNRIQVETNGFYMNVEQLIQLSGNGLTLGYVNYAKANILGADLDIKCDITNYLFASFNATLQKLTDVAKYIPQTENVPNPTYNLTIPNTPQLFFNWNAEYHRENILGSRSKTRFIYDGSFVDKYNYGFPLSIYDNLSIPSYLTHTVSMEQSFRNNRYTFTGEINNLTNENVLNNFAQPLPGRTFRIKFRYLLLGKAFDHHHLD